jgi:adenine-specific DNA-methyltransferase
MDEIFGSQNFIAEIVWHNSSRNKEYVSTEHEYILVYARHKEKLGSAWRKRRAEVAELVELVQAVRERGGTVTEATESLRKSIKYLIESENKKSGKRTKNRKYTYLTNYTNIDDEWRIYYAVDLSGDGNGPPRIFGGKEVPAPPGRHWMSQEYIDELYEQQRIVWRGDRAYRKLYIEETEETLKGIIALPTRNGREVLERLVGKAKFDNPKPVDLVKSLIDFSCDKQDLVLDSFAGSGTTGQAVLDLNREDGGNRRFILVEMDDAIARDVTARRLQRVIAGRESAKNAPAGKGKPATDDGLFAGETPPANETGDALPTTDAPTTAPEGFTFYTLGLPVVAEDGAIPEGVGDERLARHIFYTETLNRSPDAFTLPLIGVHEGTAYYLLRGDYTDDSDALLPAHGGPRVVFADRVLRSDAALKAGGVTARQLPYEVKRG